DIRYQENPTSAMLLLWQNIKQQLAKLSNLDWLWPFRPIKIFIFVVIVICMLGFFYFSLLRKSSTVPEQVKKVLPQQDNQQKPLLPRQVENKVDNSQLADKQSDRNNSIIPITPTKPNHRSLQPSSDDTVIENIDDQTMSIYQQSNLELSAIQSIYIEPFDNNPIDEEFRKLLIENLSQVKFSILTERGLAQAILEGSLKEINGKQVVEVQLVNGMGKILFQHGPRSYSDLASAASEITLQLLEAREHRLKQH
ncbi:MAG: hypothetical protein AB1489_42125, partial [Acidobacteriota bacterium]